MKDAVSAIGNHGKFGVEFFIPRTEEAIAKETWQMNNASIDFVIYKNVLLHVS